jgi:cytochrome P450
MLTFSDWTSLRPYKVIPYLVARITGQVFVGSDLGRNEEWVKLMIETTMIPHMAAQTVRAAYSPRWRCLAPWFHPAAKQVFANRRRARQLLLPTYKERVSNHSKVKKPNDRIQGLINAWKGQNRTVEQFADEQLFISMASIHTTATTTMHLLLDILAHPEYVDDLIQEIKQGHAEDGKWTKLSIAKLKKLDSFMKESQRLNLIGHSK